METSNFVTKAQVFNREVDRLDDFWVAVIDEEQHTYKGLLNIIKTICICFHGNADVERGFSANKRILQDNQKEKTLISFRHVWHAVHEVGGIQNVILTKSMIRAVQNASSRRRDDIQLQKSMEEKASISETERKTKKRRMQHLQRQREELAATYNAKRQHLEDEILILQKNC
ncbi:hypothetical protein QAD02_007094 [Eretmocerus hayati]|uniref:Uncharacterized protein n=1 Tax=Eretmocerus hayati TaxID=131215 RepID=A0ACC2N2R5_9HYME|nr:hypothetical protein QAD02_007094 [Eretmocerus hayati]